MSESKVRTRYAPSPTGHFHIGGARTALFNYLFAKHHDGTFIVRIEDTDTKRNVQGGIDSQLDNLMWLHIPPDESIRNPGNTPPYIQSADLQRYQTLALDLVKQNKAYYCFCTKEDLQKQREYALTHGLTPKYNRVCLRLTPEEISQKIKHNTPAAIRLKMPDNSVIKWHDLIRGDMAIPTSALTDPVILKSDGMPMYNFAVVVDDFNMKITHVLRGEEHLSNTPYQIAIKKALGFDTQPIQYGHLSVINDETGKKLSKRNLLLKQFIDDYKNDGYVPEALINFLALLGWSMPNGKEVLSIHEMIRHFDIDRIAKAPAFFDQRKLLWLSNQYIKTMSKDIYLTWIKEYVDDSLNVLQDKLDQVLLLFKDQISYAREINNLIIKNFLSTQINKETLTTAINVVDRNTFIKCIKALKEVLSLYTEITLSNADNIVLDVKSKTDLDKKALYFPLRFVAIAKEHGPQMNMLFYVVGKIQLLKNIDMTLSLLNAK